MNLFEYIIGGIAPHVCVQCDAEGALLCRRCIQTLPSTPSGCYACHSDGQYWQTCASCRSRSSLAAVISATAYKGAAKQLLYALKYERAAEAAKDVAAAVAERMSDLNLPQELLITHVPTAYLRMRHRGYDQSALVAKEVARRLRVPYVPLLYRLGSQRQVGQQRGARKAQMALAFRPTRTSLLANKPIMLVDDVVTTGATLEAAGSALRTAGAAEVWAAVFARA